MFTLTKVASIPTPVTNKSTEFFSGVKSCRAWEDESGAIWCYGEQRVNLTADLTGSTSTTLADVTGLVFPVRSGVRYAFEFILIYQQASTTTTGLKIGLTFPAVTVFSANAIIPGVTIDGTANIYAGAITTSGDSVAGSGVEAAGTNYEAYCRGSILPSANGNLQLQWAAEVGSAGAITPKNGSSGRMWLT